MKQPPETLHCGFGQGIRDALSDLDRDMDSEPLSEEELEGVIKKGIRKENE